MTGRGSVSKKLKRLAFRVLSLLSRIKKPIIGKIVAFLGEEESKSTQYKPMTVTEFRKRENISAKILIRSIQEETPHIEFYCPAHFLPRNPKTAYASPCCELIEFESLTVMGRTDLLFKDDRVIHPDQFQPDEHIETLEQFNLGKYSAPDNVFTISDQPVTRTIKQGINLLAGGAGNYAHFISEVIPKLLALDNKKEYLDYPLLVDGWIGDALKKIIVYFNANCREVIPIDSFERVRVEKLVHITSATFAPQDFRVNFSTSKNPTSTPTSIVESYLFSSAAMNMIRDYAWNKSRQSPSSTRKPTAKRIYLKRNSNFIDGVQYNLRSILNEEEVHAILKDHGFMTVDTTTMSFQEQIETFKEATIVASPLGAALTNSAFCAPGSIIFGLGAYYKDADYSYHANMMAALQHRYIPVLGSQWRQSGQHPMHNSYAICTTSLRRALAQIPSPTS